MHTAPHLLTCYLSFWTPCKTEATVRSKTDVKQRGCRAFLFITGQWSTLIDSPVTFLFINPARTTTQPITGWSIASRQTRCHVAKTNLQHQTWEQAVIPFYMHQLCAAWEFVLCLWATEAARRCPNFACLCIFSFVRASHVVLNVKTASRHSGLPGFKRNPAGVEKLGNKKTDFRLNTEDFVDRDEPKRVICPSLTSLTYLAKLTGWRAAAVDSMAFEVE